MSLAASAAAGGAGTVRSRVVVVRHGETEYNAKGVWQGQLDIALSALGRRQAAAAAAAVAAYEPRRVVGSDLVRAAETARLLADAVGVTPETDARFREIHAGQWQGMTLGESAERFPDAHAAIAAGEDLRRGVDGESVTEVVARARPAFDELAASLDGDTAVIVSHGVTARALVADVIGLEQRQAWMSLVGLRNCHWAVLEEYGDTWRLRAWNVGPDVGDPR